MAYLVSAAKQAINGKNVQTVVNAVEALLKICPQEGYPNGNNGLSETHIRKYFKTLADCGVSLECMQRGNPSIMGVYEYRISETVTDEQANKAYQYALSEIKEYADGVSDTDSWKKWRILHALETLNPDVVSIKGRLIVSLNGTPFSTYASIEKMLPEILAVMKVGVK